MNSTAKARSGSLKPVNASGDSRFMTVSDSYFNRSRQTHNGTSSPKDIEAMRNHYKFHKGTSYQIGNSPNAAAGGTSVAQESYSPKKRFESSDILPGRRNQEASTGAKNQNKVGNFQIGQNNMSVRGSDAITGMNTRSNSTYNSVNKGTVTG